MDNLKAIIDNAVSSTKSAGLSFFDSLKGTIGKVGQSVFPTATTAFKALNEPLKKIPDNSTAGIVKNTVTGLPKATVDLGKQIVLGVLRIPFSTAEGIYRARTGKTATEELPAMTQPFGLGELTSYQTEYGKRKAAGESSLSAGSKTAAQIALDEPFGLAFKPIALAGSLFMKSGGAKIIQESLDTIAKSKSADEILDTLSKLKGIPKNVAEEVAPKLVELTDKKQIQSVIDGALASSQKSNKIYQGVGEGKQSNYWSLNRKDAEGYANQKGLNGKGKVNEINWSDIPDEVKTISPEDSIAEVVRKELGDSYIGRPLTREEFGKVQQHLYLEDKITAPLLGKERGLITSVKTNKGFAPEVKQGASDFYTPITNEETLINAKYLADNQIDEAYKLVNSEGPATALSNTVALELVGRLQNEAAALRATDLARSNKLFQDAVDIVEKTAKKATTQGQAIQALSMWSKMTPEGILLHTQKTIDKANDLLPKGKPKITLSPEKAGKLTDEINRINKLPEGEDKIVDTAVLLKDIQDIIPASISKKIATIQTLAQLLNTKTPIRNLIGNAGFAIAENVSGVFASTLDAIIPGKKVIGFPSLKIQAKGFKDGLREGYRDAMKGIDTSGISSKFEIPVVGAFKGEDGKLSKVGAALEKTLNVSLKAPDRAFFKSAYDDSLARQMKAKGVDKPTDEMLEIAVRDGEYRTFQDENTATYIFKGIKKALNVGKEFGAGDFILKYPKTPANLLNRGLAYTPAGFFRTLFELSRPLIGKGAISRKTSLESFSRAFVGTTGLFGVGATLYDLGLISSGRNSDRDVADLKDNVGLGAYKVNLSGLKRFVLSGFDAESTKLEEGDTLASYDWLQPFALPVAMGANFAKNKGDTSSYLARMIDAVGAGSEALGEQPLIKGVTSAFREKDISKAVQSVAGSIPQSFVPTIVSQVRQLVDSQKRELYDPKPLTYSLNLAKNRIPFLSSTLPAKLSSFGEEVPMYQTGNNIFNVLFNPAFTSKYKPTSEAELVIDLQNETGETKQFPRVPEKSIIVNGESKKLTAKERWNMQLYAGTVTREIFNARANSETFNALPTDEKISELSSDLTAIGSAAKIIILGDIPKKKPSKKTMELIQAFQQSN